MDKDKTFIIPVIRPDLLSRCLETLYKYTDRFYVFVIDQTYEGLPQEELRNKYQDLMFIRPPKTEIHTKGNLGFAKATNLGISLVDTPYFIMCNDDVEFVNKRWWEGVLEAFYKVDEATPETPCISVTPSSIKLPDWSLGRKAGDDFFILPYKEDYSEEDYDHLINDDHYLNEHLTLKPGSVIDGITFYCSVFKTKDFLKVGMLDERYYPGGAEDYDYCCRAYVNNYRAVGTTMSWVFHHWSSSFKTIQDQENVKRLIDDKLRLGDHNEIWGKDRNGENYCDVWGTRCPECRSQMRMVNGIVSCKDHPEEIYNLHEPGITPL